MNFEAMEILSEKVAEWMDANIDGANDVDWIDLVDFARDSIDENPHNHSLKFLGVITWNKIQKANEN